MSGGSLSLSRPNNNTRSQKDLCPKVDPELLTHLKSTYLSSFLVIICVL